MKKKELFTITALIFFAFAGLALRNFPFSHGNLDEAIPPVITSYDVFANTEHTKWIYDSEQAYYYHPARTGGLEHVISTHPTLYYLFIASFTKLTTIPPYQTAYLAVNILSIIIILQLFIIIRKLFGDDIALISLALGTIPEAKWLFPMYVGFQYDYFTFAVIPAMLFFIIHRYENALHRYQKTILYTLFGLFFTEQFLGHYVEFFFYAPFFAIIPFITPPILKKITNHTISPIHLKSSKISFAEYFTAFAIIALILTPFMLYFFPLTAKDHLRGGFLHQLQQQTSPEASKHLDYFPWPRFTFWLNLFSIIGLAALILNFKKNLTPNRLLYLLFLTYLLFVGFSNYTLGVWANRVERQLFQGYPFLALLPALGITTITKTLLKILRLPNKNTLATLAIIGVISYTSFTPAYNTLSAIDASAFVDKEKWASIEWMRDTTPQNSRAFFLSGFEHEFSMFSERVNLKGDLNRVITIENIQSLCSGKYPKNYSGEWALREYTRPGLETYVRKRTGIFSFDDIIDPFQNISEGYVFVGPERNYQWVPLKFFDYVVLQYKGTQFDPCMAFFINQSLEKGHTIPWFNNKMAIIKINKNAQP